MTEKSLLQMRHALFVSFQYPPDASSSGVLRTLKYTRYLAEHGWRVTVVSPDASCYETIDDASLSNIPDTVKVVRTRYLDTKLHLGVRGRYPAIAALPDRFIGWLPWALAAGTRIGLSDPVDLIYSTSPPATAHLIAWCLARRLKKPWVADFRDPWFEEPAEEGAPSGRVFRKLDRWLEQRVVADCMHVVTTTQSMQNMLLTRYASLARSKFSVIPNGYDEFDFMALPLPANSSTDHLCIVHAGNINPGFRDPMRLVSAIKHAAELGIVEPDKIRVRFLGGGAYAESNELRLALIDSGLSANVEMISRLPYSDALRQLAAADVLLLLQASEDTRGLVPAKLYEYLRLQKPVLALTLPGEVSALLEQTGGGFTADPADSAQVVLVLGEIYRRWREGTLVRGGASQTLVKQYERRALAGKLAAIFACLADASPGPG